MKLILTCLLSLGLLAGALAQSATYHGKKINDRKAIPATELASKMTSQTEMPAKVEGTVTDVCRAKGCWMKVQTGDGQTMRVTFRDYGFFVPKDIVGKKVVFEGTAQQSTTSVDEQRHYAEDAGKSKEEIARITEPKKELTFVADGVLVKN